MNNQNLWQHIVQRIEAGESRRSIAQEFGITEAQFRYRLRKYLAKEQAVLANVAACGDELQGNPYDETLFDESWKRTWQTNRIVLMLKEPNTLFVYWEVDNLRKSLLAEHFQTGWANMPLFLQLSDVTLIDFNGYNAVSTRRIQVNWNAENWYIHQVEPGRRYMADLGTTTLKGDFFCILRSNIVETPPWPRRGLQPSLQFAPAPRAANRELAAAAEQEQEQGRPGSMTMPDGFDGYTVHQPKEVG